MLNGKGERNFFIIEIKEKKLIVKFCMVQFIKKERSPTLFWFYFKIYTYILSSELIEYSS